MRSLFAREVLAHPVVLGSFVLAILVAIGSGWYYVSASRVPTLDVSLTSASSTDPVSDITATGVVAPAENPDLSFVSGGRVVSVSVAVGQSVNAGATLAALDTASLVAARDQAAANVRAQEARLDEMRAGPRDIDLSQKQTAIAQAKQSLANLYDSAATDIGSSYSAVLGSMHANADTLFNQPDSSAPNLVFQTTDTQAALSVEDARVKAGTALSAWSTETGVSDPAAIEAELSRAQSHALVVRALVDGLTMSLSQAVPSGSFPAASVTAAQASVSSLHTTVETAITKLQSDMQAIQNAKLAEQSAQDALAQAQAGSTKQQIDAQSAAVDAAAASLASANAAIANAVVVAPYSGTVSAVHVKRGDIVAPNTVAVSLTPNSALQFEAYLSEVDAPRTKAGDIVAITLDAYGTGKVFPARIVSVDRSPTIQGGVPAYKVVAQFASDDSALTPGMTGSIVIHTTN